MTLALHNPAKPHLKRWTKREYIDAIGKGMFAGKRVFLYRGELIEMPSMGGLHAQAVKRLGYYLHEKFRPDFEIRVQMPFECVDQSMPEPDAGVFTAEQDARRPHPNAALWLIEVADSSVELDREKAFEYAASRVPEYWIVNLPEQSIEVYSEPISDASTATGHRYSVRVVHRGSEMIAPAVRPNAALAVADLVRLA
jgi:Uma2 family endonuclease